MGFWNTLFGVGTKITEPVFVKDISDAHNQLAKLEEILPLAADDKISKEIEQDIKRLSYGIKGEDAVAYELKNSFMPILILRDLNLKHHDLTAQIDYIVVASEFVLVVECKALSGDVEITSSGDFVRVFKSVTGKPYKKEGIYSPIVQNERHVALVKKILEEHRNLKGKKLEMIRSVVVVANPKTIINAKNAPPEICSQIIKHEQLVSHIKKLKETNANGYYFDDDGMQQIADIFLKLNFVNETDYTAKYELKEPPKTLDNETAQENGVYKALKAYRLAKSKEEGVKAYYIFKNETLDLLVQSLPASLEELRNIEGFGEVKCSKYGEDIIKTIKDIKP